MVLNMESSFKIIRSSCRSDKNTKRKHAVVYGAIGSLILYCIGMVTTFECFISYFKPEINRFPLYIAMLFVIVVNYYIFCSKKHGLYVAAAYVAGSVILIGVNWVNIVDGVCAVLNKMLEAFEMAGGGSYVRFHYIGESPKLAWGLALFLMLMSSLIAFAIFKNHMLCGALVVLTAAIYGTWVNAMPNMYWFAGSISFVVCLIAMNRKKSVNLWCAGSFGAYTIAFFAFLIAIIFTPSKEFQRLPVFDALNGVVNNVSTALGLPNFRLRSDNGGAELGIGGGLLPNIDISKSGNKKVFELTTFAPDSDLYLKGFVGSLYTGESWETPNLDDENNVNSYMYKRRSEELQVNSYNQSYYTDFLILGNSELRRSFRGMNSISYGAGNGYTIGEMTINMVDDDAYYYYPYGAAPYENGYVIGVELKNLDGYPLNPPLTQKYQCIDHHYDDYNQYQLLMDRYNGTNKSVQNYVMLEDAYRDFVMENYTTIDDSVFDGVDLSALDRINVTDSRSIDTYVKAVQEFLKSYRYTLNPADASNRDFINNFLAQTKEGYCTSFASAGVALLRRKGIPARYVEGFLIPRDKILEGQKSVSETTFNNAAIEYNTYTIDVYSDCAHAWAEIYKPGYGWIPVEFTNSYNDTDSNERPSQSIAVEDNDDDGDDDDEEDDDTSDDDEQTDEETIAVNTKKDDEADTFPVFTVIIVVFVIIIVILIAVAAVLNYMSKKRNIKQLLSRNSKAPRKVKMNKTAVKLYLYMEKLAAVKGCLRGEDEDYLVFTERIAGQFNCFTQEEIYATMEIILKARFSKETLTVSELETVRLAAVKMRKEVYETVKGKDKFVLKYIKVY